MAQSFDPHQTGIEQHSTRIGTANLYYEVAGAGKPLILIHGLSGSSRWWERNIAALAQHFRVYVVDLVGFGASRSDAPFALAEAEQVLYTWMERLAIRQASIVGHSMGGVIAAELAADYPALVERLILVDAAILSFTSTFPYHLVQLFREMAYVPPRLQYIIATDALRAGARTLWNASHELLMTDIRAKLAKIQAPVLLIWGGRDKLVPLRLGEQLYRYLPHATFVVIPNAGHIPMWECPREFNRLVLDFLHPHS